MSHPPGIVYLVKNSPKIVAPPAVVLAANVCLRRSTGVSVPVWLLVLGCLSSFPLALFISVQWGSYKNKRAAAAVGAVLPPLVESKRIGGMDLVLDQLRTFDRNFLAYLIFEYAEKYGNVFSRTVFFDTKVTTLEPEHLKMILATDFPSFEKGRSFRHQMESLLGTGVFNVDGDMWKFHRGMTRPFFTKERISHFDIFDRHADDAFKKAKARIAEGYAVNWQDLASRFTLDSATEFLFGEDVCTLSAGLPYPPSTPLGQQKDAHFSNSFSQAFLAAQSQSMARSRLMDAWPLFEFWEDKVKSHMKTIDGFVDPLIEGAIKRKREKDKNKEVLGEEDTTTLLEHLVGLTDDRQVIKDEIVNFLLAGRDTTTCTLTFTVYKLAQHPHVLRRLREEIISKVGTTRRPTYEDIRDMKFLRAVINETLRLYPPVPFNFRATTKDVVLPPVGPNGKPYFVAANTRIQYFVFVMHRRKDLWGPDALEYDPDRFLDERLHKYLTPNPYIFVPFNAGPRICLGQQFAYNEASFMLVRLLQQFSEIHLDLDANPAARAPAGFTDCSGSNGEDEVLISTHLTMHVKGGLWLRMAEPADAA